MSTDSETTQETPGTIVREARESLGLSVADIAAMTRIPKTMLEHLEADRYEEYPAEVFARGHLRNYAREVDLEPELVLQTFERHTGEGETETVESGEAETREDRDESHDHEASLDSGGPIDRVEWSQLWDRVQPSHLFAAILILAGLFGIFSLTGENRATAQDSNEFPDSERTAEQNWNDSLDQRADKSQWLIKNQSAETASASDSSNSD